MAKDISITDLLNQITSGKLDGQIAIYGREIEELKKEFASPDYKTTKNIQYEKLGKPVPYAWEDVYMEAEAIRKQINEREEKINHAINYSEAQK